LDEKRKTGSSGKEKNSKPLKKIHKLGKRSVEGEVRLKPVGKADNPPTSFSLLRRNYPKNTEASLLIYGKDGIKKTEGGGALKGRRKQKSDYHREKTQLKNLGFFARGELGGKRGRYSMTSSKKHREIAGGRGHRSKMSLIQGRTTT